MDLKNRRTDDPITVTLGQNEIPVEYRPKSASESSHARGFHFQEFDEQPEKSLQDYIGIIFKRRRAILIVFLAVVSLTAAYTFTRVPIYRASATLEFEKEASNSINTLGESLAPIGHRQNSSPPNQAY